MTKGEAAELTTRLLAHERVVGADVRHTYPQRPKDPGYVEDDYSVAFCLNGPAAQWWLVHNEDDAWVTISRAFL